MAITPRSVTTPRLNLPPLRAREGGKGVDAAELDRFTRAIQEWGVQVDRMNNSQADQLLVVENDLTSIQSSIEAATAIPPWLDMPIATGWANLGGYQAAEYRKIGTRVEARFMLNRTGAGLAASAVSTIFTGIPAELRPPAQLVLIGICGDAASFSFAGIYVRTTGNIDVQVGAAIASGSGYTGVSGQWWTD